MSQRRKTDFFVSKSVDGAFNVGINYHEPDLEGAETITAVDVESIPAGLTLGTPQITATDDGVYVAVSGGVAGKTYLVLFKVTTSTAKIFNNPDYDAIKVKVNPKLAP